MRCVAGGGGTTRRPIVGIALTNIGEERYEAATASSAATSHNPREGLYRRVYGGLRCARELPGNRLVRSSGRVPQSRKSHQFPDHAHADHIRTIQPCGYCLSEWRAAAGPLPD